MNRISIMFAVVALAGCATQNIAGTAAYSAVPQTQLLSEIEQPSPQEPHAKIIVKRDTGAFGYELASIFSMDSKQLMRVKPGQYSELRVTPGEHIFGVGLTTIFDKSPSSYAHEMAIDCKAGNTYYIRLYPQAGNGVAIERSSQ